MARRTSVKATAGVDPESPQGRSSEVHSMEKPSEDNASGAQGDALTIRGVRTRLVEVPMRYALGTSADVVRVAPLLLVDLQTEEGVTGHCYLFCYRRSGGRAIAAVLDRKSTRLNSSH